MTERFQDVRQTEGGREIRELSRRDLKPDISEVRNVEVGEVFNPFERLSPLSITGSETLAETEFNFRGAKGTISIFQDDEFLQDLIGESVFKPGDGVVMPFGPVKKLVEVGEQGNVHVIDTLVRLQFYAIARNENQLRDLSNHAMELKIGESIYHILPTAGIKGVESADGGQLNEFGWVEHDKKEIDKSGRAIYIWLSYDPAKLRAIEAKFVARPQNQS